MQWVERSTATRCIKGSTTVGPVRQCRSKYRGRSSRSSEKVLKRLVFNFWGRCLRSARARPAPEPTVLAACLVGGQVFGILTFPGFALDSFERLSYQLHHVLAPSSSGLGHRPFTAVTRVQTPLGSPFFRVVEPLCKAARFGDLKAPADMSVSAGAFSVCS